MVADFGSNARAASCWLTYFPGRNEQASSSTRAFFVRRRRSRSRTNSAYLRGATRSRASSPPASILRRATAARTPGAKSPSVQPINHHTHHRKDVATLARPLCHEAPLADALGQAAQPVVLRQRRIQEARSEVRKIWNRRRRPLGRRNGTMMAAED
jgi:hypothetical protein